MLDINFIKENPDRVKKTLIDRHSKVSVDIDKLISDYDNYLKLLRDVEKLRAQRNTLTEEISKAGKDKNPATIEQAGKIKKDIQELEAGLESAKTLIDEQVVQIPNVTSEKMPVGQSEADNVVTKIWDPQKGYIEPGKTFKNDDLSHAPVPEFEYKDHVELGELLDVIDVKQSAKVSGSRFSYLKGDLVILQDAMSSFFKSHLNELGFIPFIPPSLVRERSLFGTSHFPEHKEQVYKIENINVEEGAELYLLGSSETANFSYFMDKVLDAQDMPIKVYAQTACFRSEVGSWGKDVKGIKRVHQFDKLEMNSVCKPDQAEEIFELFLSINEWFYQQIKVPYRVVNKCTGDCGYNASYYQHDIEVWRPAAKEYMELGSNTITTDYQARRMNIKYKEDGKLRYAYTVNDTGIPFGRALIVVLENYQRPDGSVEIPEVLQKYTGFKELKPKAKK